MKAWVVVKNAEPAQALALKEVGGDPSAAPPKGADVVVRVTHAALNPADLHFMLHIPTWVPFRRHATPGLDFAGEVVQLGPQAAAAPAHAAAPLAVGARVCGCMSVGLVATGHGALAEYVTVPADLLARPPKSFAENLGAAAGLLGVAGQTAHLALTDPAAQAVFDRAAGAGGGGVGDGDGDAKSASAGPRQPRVLVNGASGGVGSLLVQAAKARGAFVAGVCSAANAAFVTEALGADEAVDYRAHDPLSAYLAAAYGDAKSFDLIFDCVGDQPLFTKSAAYLSPKGALLCIVGGPSQGVVPFVRNKLVPTFLGGTPRTYKILGLAPSGQRARDVATWAADGTFQQMPVDSEFAMADVVKAYEKLATKRARGKIIIKVQD